MILLLARFFYYYNTNPSLDETEKLTLELLDLKDKFVRLWKVKNRDVGHEIFSEKFDLIIRFKKNRQVLIM